MLKDNEVGWMFLSFFYMLCNYIEKIENAVSVLNYLCCIHGFHVYCDI